MSPRRVGWLVLGVGAVAASALGVSLYSSVSTLGSLLGLAPEGQAPEIAAPRPGAPAEDRAVVDAPPAERPPPLGPQPQRPEQQAQLLPPPEPGSWDATPIAARGRALGRAGVDLEQGLLEYQDALSRCFVAGARSADEASPVQEVAHPAVDDTGSTVVVLHVEARGGELRVVDAPVEIRAGASATTLGCVQATLRQVRVASEAPPPSPRFRLRFTVSP